MNESSSSTEAEWLAALKGGDAAAFERLVRDYGQRVLKICERLLFNHEDAREATQEVFLSAFRGVSRFDGRSQFSTWLHRIAVTTALMKLRSRRRHPERSIEELLPTFLDDGHQAQPGSRWSESVLNSLQQAEVRQLIRTKIEMLPESYRNVLILRDIEELDANQVADLLQISPGAVKVRLHRARQALRTLLEPVFGESKK